MGQPQGASRGLHRAGVGSCEDAHTHIHAHVHIHAHIYVHAQVGSFKDAALADGVFILHILHAVSARPPPPSSLPRPAPPQDASIRPRARRRFRPPPTTWPTRRMGCWG